LPSGAQGTISQQPGAERRAQPSPPASGASGEKPAAHQVDDSASALRRDPISVYGAAGRMVDEPVSAGFSVLA
jgi:hypothetical protein